MQVKDEYVADVRQYSGPLREAAKEADRFAERNDKAALAARRMGLAASEAADKAARAQRDAADAAEKLAKGEIKADEAAQAAAKAERELERASIKAAEAERATAKAANEAAQQYRQMARDAELAAAAQRLGSLKAAGAAKDYNALLGKLKAEHGNLSKTAVAGFKEMETGFKEAEHGIGSGLTELTGMGRAMPSAILVGLQLLPSAAAVAGGGITLALGGALSAIGIKAQASAKDVQAAFSGLRAHVVSELQKWTKPYHDTLMSIAIDAEKSFDRAGPAITEFSAKAAPAITRFAHNALASFGELRPMVDSLGTAFQKTLDSLGPEMPTIMANIGTGIKSITDAVAANPGALTGFVEGLSRIIRVTGDGIGFLIRYSGAINEVARGLNAFIAGPLGVALNTIYKAHSMLQGGSTDWKTFGQSASGAGSATDAAAASMGTSEMATEQLLTTQRVATMTTDELKAALDRLTGANQNAFDAETAYRQALLAATAQAKASNAGIDGNSKAAVANRSALSSLSQAIKGVMENSNPTAAAVERMRQRFIATAVNMGVSRAEARRLADQLLGVRDAVNRVPSSKRIALTDNAVSTTRRVNAVRAALNALHDKTINITTYYRQVDIANRTNSAERGDARGNAHGGYIGYAGGGEVARLAGGGPSGPVRGPGTGTSDSIPVRLSNGEYVINAEQTAKYRPLLDAINYKLDGFAKGGGIKPIAQAGGYKGATSWIGQFGWDKSSPLTGIFRDAAEVAAEQRIARARATPEHAAAMAAQDRLSRMRNSIYGGFFRGAASVPGYGHDTVVQHVTTVNLTVQGSIRSDRDLIQMIQSQLLNGRKNVTLPAGR